MRDGAIRIDETAQEATVRLHGQVDTAHVAGIWREVSAALHRPGLRRFTVNLDGVSGIDSAGVALLQLIARACRERRIEYEHRQVPPAAEEFLRYATEQSQAEADLTEEQTAGMVSRAGLRALELVAAGRDLAEFTGNLLLETAVGLRHPRRIRVREILYQMQKAGAEAAIFVSSLAVLMGFIMGIQASATLTRFGAGIRIADVVTTGTLKEMAPLLMAVIVAGRSGAAFTAEIGTMKIRQEIDALRVMGLEPMGFLVLPRVLGLALAGPFLTLIADAAGVIGGMIVGWLILDLSVANFFAEVGKAINVSDFFQGLFKGMTYAVLIGINGCFHGLRTGTAAEDVGVQTTTAVVIGILIIILTDALLSGIFHVYDI